MKTKYTHIISIFQALLVTFLWSTSFIIIKWGLIEIPPITYAGLRYFIAFLCFIPFIFRKKYIAEIKQLKPFQWKKLILLGFVFYTFTQGAQFLGLSLLPSVTVSLMLNFTPIIVAIMAIFLLSEKPTTIQWIGSSLFIVGIITYFLPISLIANQAIGLLVMLIGVLANAISAIIGRDINRNKDISPLVITFISMGVGAIILIIIGFSMNGIPEISFKTWGFLLWLAVINTAFAFTLWNLTLRTLTAMESSIINGTMLIQIAILAWYFLDETITFKEGIGMSIAAFGAVLVQIKKRGNFK
ncbi:MAG: DMT family transporter [Bacteroidetes bacterium]|nr:DMT family transporter [Bacteroidota bacterium]MBU1116600.1 DMT family transporter [Bacteroidota bacterium]MBU1797717.1 DMT family transporter [Bacteroidota bacterium]